jgi:anti-sigma-K factor RskA
MGSNHEEIKDLVAAYVLGAVGREEIPLVRAHILSCDECMAEADRLADTAATLALDVEDVPLGRDFADRVVAAAREGTPTETAPVGVMRRRWRSLPALAAAAMMLVVAVMGATLLDTRAELQRNEQAIAALLRAGEGMDLKGTGATAKLVPAGSGSYFVVAGLHEAPQNHTYQLWLLRDGAPTSVTTFDVENGLTLVATDRELEGFDAAAVTVEPEGGSPAPTSDPILISG